MLRFKGVVLILYFNQLYYFFNINLYGVFIFGLYRFGFGFNVINDFKIEIVLNKNLYINFVCWFVCYLRGKKMNNK